MSPITPVTTDNLEQFQEAKPSPRQAAFAQSGNVVRLEVPIPFLMRDEVFTIFNKEGYSWTPLDGSGGAQRNLNPKRNMVIFAEVPEAVKRVTIPPPEELSESRSNAAPVKGNLDAQYSIGGCPLECPFDLNEDFDEALCIDEIPTVFAGLKIPSRYERMTMDNGSWAIRQASAQMEPFVREINLMKYSDGYLADDMPVCSFIDATDQNSGVTLKGFRGKFQSIHMHCMGKWTPEAPILTVEAFRKYHEQNLNVENKPMTTVAHAIYEKLHGEYLSRGKVFMEFVFKEPVNVFELPPEDSLSKIAIQPMKGDANPSMASLWKELEELERWIGLLAKCSEHSGGADATNFLDGSAFEIDEGKLAGHIKAVQDLLIQDPGIDLLRASSMEYSDSLDFVLARVIKLERADCDFTDRLWSVVRSCENVEELQECLQTVFKAVSNKMYRPYLLPGNETAMAKLLLTVMKGELGGMLEMRKHTVMVMSVIECGLVKLFKDYNFVLATSHLIERGDVQSFAPSKDFPSSLQNLTKLHCILEVMCLSKERLTLSVNIQAGHVQKLLKMFSNPNPLNWNEPYHFDVPPSDLRRVMSGLHPIYFKAKMKSQTFLKWAETSVIVSPENYVTHKRLEGNKDVAGRQYYVYVYCENGRLGRNGRNK